MAKISFIVLLLGPVALGGCLANPVQAVKPAASAAYESDVPADLRANAERWLEEEDVPSMAVAAIGPEGVKWTEVFGEQSPGIPSTRETLFNVASLTKPLVAETMLALVNRGRLSLDAPIASVYMDPQLADDPRAADITLRYLLSHRSGFPQNWRRMMQDGVLAIAWQPGTRAYYSGENYELAAKYAAATTGEDLDELAREFLFAPARITDIWFRPDPSWEGRVAMVRGPDGSLRLPETSEVASAADNVHATIEGYASFVSFAMNGSGLTPELQDARGTIYADESENACPEGIIPAHLCPTAVGFGLGWQIYDSGKNRFFIHSGKDWGERTIAVFEPSKRQGFVIFTTGANGRQVISNALKVLVDDPKLNALVEAEARFEKMQRSRANQ